MLCLLLQPVLQPIGRSALLWPEKTATERRRHLLWDHYCSNPEKGDALLLASTAPGHVSKSLRPFAVLKYGRPLWYGSPYIVRALLSRHSYALAGTRIHEIPTWVGLIYNTV